MRATLVLALLLLATTALPLAAADVVVPVYVCDVESGTCTCQELRVREPFVEAGRRCTFW